MRLPATSGNRGRACGRIRGMHLLTVALAVADALSLRDIDQCYLDPTLETLMPRQDYGVHAHFDLELTSSH